MVATDKIWAFHQKLGLSWSREQLSTRRHGYLYGWRRFRCLWQPVDVVLYREQIHGSASPRQFRSVTIQRSEQTRTHTHSFAGVPAARSLSVRLPTAKPLSHLIKPSAHGPRTSRQTRETRLEKSAHQPQSFHPTLRPNFPSQPATLHSDHAVCNLLRLLLLATSHNANLVPPATHRHPRASFAVRSFPLNLLPRYTTNRC